MNTGKLWTPNLKRRKKGKEGKRREREEKKGKREEKKRKEKGERRKKSKRKQKTTKRDANGSYACTEVSSLTTDYLGPLFSPL